MDDSRAIDRDDPAARLAALGRIDYFLSELRSLRDRGLVPAEAVSTAEAEKAAIRSEIERIGAGSDAIRAARSRLLAGPREALASAEAARRLAPERPEGWELSVAALGRLREFDLAIAVCREAAEAHGHDRLLGKIAGFEAEKALLDRSRGLEDALNRARASAIRGDHAEALAAIREALAIAPGHALGLSMAVGALAALGRFDEAEAARLSLRAVAPAEAAQWAGRLRQAREKGQSKPPIAREIHVIGDLGAGPEAVWSFAEFLEDHWQKLILALAVVLIAVSSTVGASIILGDRLWRAEGKCLLATAYTLVFAGFGRALARWGAERAGRIMRLTTLIVLPLNFALVGELPIHDRSTAIGLATIAVDSAAMMALAWIVCRALGLSGGKTTPIALMALGMIDALTPRSASFPAGFSAILAGSAAFAASSARLSAWVARRGGSGKEDVGGDVASFAAGLLGLYAACLVVRVGGLLHLPATLYALPVMLASAAALLLADGLSSAGRPGHRPALLRLIGHGLSGLAFALGLAIPPGRGAIFEANTLAGAVAGLAIYTRELRRRRHPASLYAAFAALFLAYFAAQSSLHAMIFSRVEAALAAILGYGRTLPIPFRALNGLALNAALAALALFFSGRWGDRRLARHCQRIALPLSVAACVFSAFEPTAALLTLGAYAIAYAIAARVFAEPRVLYLACSAFVGAWVAAASLLGSPSIGGWSIVLTTAGAVLRLSTLLLARSGVSIPYRVPISRSTRAVAVASLALAAVSAWPASWAGAGAFAMVSILAISISMETPRASIASAAVGSAAVAALLAIRLSADRLGWPLGPSGSAASMAILGVFSEWLGPRVGSRRESGAIGPNPAAVFATPICVLGLVLASAASILLVVPIFGAGWRLSAIDLFKISATLALIAGSPAIASALRFQAGSIALAASLAGGCASTAAILALGSLGGWAPGPAFLGLSIGLSAIGLAALGDRVRGVESGWPALYRGPLLGSTFLAAGLSWAIGAGAWREPTILALTLGVSSVALAVAVRVAPVRPLPEVALVGGLAAWLVGRGSIALAMAGASPRIALLAMLYLAAALLVAEIARIGPFGSRRGRARDAFGAAFPDFALLLTTIALPIGLFGVSAGDLASATGIFAIGSVALLRMPRDRRPIEGFDHAGLILAWLASGLGAVWVLGPVGPSGVLAWVAMASAAFGSIAARLRWTRRGRIDAALRDVGLSATIASLPIAIAGSLLSLDAYPIAVSAMLLAIPSFVASAAIDRSAWRVHGATIAGVAAAYLTLFEMGRGRQGHVGALGVLASGLAVGCWFLGRLASRDRRAIFEAPMGQAAVALAVLAIPFDWDAVGPLLIASVPFLLILRSRKGAVWLYPAIALVVAASGFASFRRFGTPGLAPWALASAFACSILGSAIRRGLPSRERRYDIPASRAAIALGLAALVIRLDATVRPGEAWSAHPWIPAAIGFLSLGMLATFRQRVWLDGFVGLSSLAILSACAPGLDSPMAWALAGLALATLWRAAPAATGGAIDLRLGIEAEGRLIPWSLGFLALASLPLATRSGFEVVSAAFDPSAAPVGPREWWAGSLAVLLFLANVDLAGRDWPGDRRRLGLDLGALLLAWWVAIPGSPILARAGLDPRAILPLISASMAFLAAIRGSRTPGRLLAYSGFGLAIAAVALTGGRTGPGSTSTFFLAAAVAGRIALADREAAIVGVGAILWGLACGFASIEVAGRVGWGEPPSTLTALAAGQAIAALGLVASARRTRALGAGLVAAADRVAGLSLAAAASLALLSGLGPTTPGRALANVAVLFAVGSICAVLASRWSSMAAAIAAQASILLGYLAFRGGFAMTPAGDSTAILILAGIDLGIAEVAGRSRRTLFAMPALAAGLILPLISAALSFRAGSPGDVPVVALFAAGTFYAAAGGRLRRKGLAYAAAVLYNAALWVLWANFGWEFAGAPQFYLVPVGLSTVLFAEANRRELGRTQVNAIRCLGLTLIYFTLAFPIWRTASLGAWALILALSLAAIFAGIGLRAQAFLWMGLSAFLLDLAYQLGRVGMEHDLAKWAIMLGLGLGLFLFVALNEKKRLLATIREAVGVVLGWD